MTNRSNILLSLAMPLLGTLVAFGILELGIRLFAAPSRQTSPAWDDRPLFYYRSPSAPSMQDFPYQVPKPDGIFRIAAIGDSFTFAPYMQFTDTYVKKLEKRQPTIFGLFWQTSTLFQKETRSLTL